VELTDTPPNDALGRQGQFVARIEGIMIQLVGPGGAGKTTVGRALAGRLGVTFVDLDEQFCVQAGDISAFLAAHGYPAYSALNIEAYLEMLGSLRGESVVALSSGFMTYPDDAHPAYPALYRDIMANPLTLVLLPSFDRESCVAETVRRQLTRPFSRSAEQEEQVIRARFGVYRGLPAKQFETNKPVDAVVDQVVAHVLPNIRLPPTAVARS
jgi:shikimate kinase